MPQLNVELIPAFKDYYIYLLRQPGSGDVGIVDAGDAKTGDRGARAPQS